MKLEEVIEHSVDEVSDMLNASEPFSAFEDYIDFKVLIIRRIEFVKESLSFRAESFILKGKDIFYLDRDANELTKLKRSFSSLLIKLEGYYKSNQKIMSAYSGQIEQLEDFLFDRNLPSVFMDIWFDLKKDLSKLENYYYRNSIVYHEFYRKNEADFGKLKDEYKDIEENIHFQTSNINSLKTRLDGLHHYYASIKNDRLNKTLLILTMISGIFLPLNLIVGFFGMNTPGLFFMDNPYGTQEVLVILGSVLLICLLGFPMIKLMDQLLLRNILGRYSFYKNISKQIDELGGRLRGK